MNHPVKLTSSILMLLLLSISAQAAGWQKALQSADHKAQKKCYHSAIKKYKHILGQSSLPADSAYRVNAGLAECYMKRGRSIKAEGFYADAVKSPLASANTIFNYARCLESNGKYADAKAWFDKVADDKLIKEKMPKAFSDKCEIAIKYHYDNRNAIQRQHFNTQASESAPAYYKKGIAFATNASKCGKPTHRTRERYTETYMQYEDKGDLVYADAASVKLCKKLKGKAVTFNATNDEAFITKRHRHHLQIFESRLHGHHWSCPKKLYFELPGVNYAYAALSPDGNNLYFSSDISGGQGGMDLYVTHRNGKYWDGAVNLGPSVNTSGNETFPFLSGDSSLYFSSDGLPGYGGTDLFHTKLKDGKLAKAENMGVDFNSPKDDISMIVDSKTRTGFLASNRDGDRDIYSFRLPSKKNEEKEKKQEAVRTGKIVDKSTGTALSGARVEISRPSSPEEGAFYYSNDSGLIHPSGRIDKDDEVRVSLDKYRTKSFNAASIADQKSFEIALDSEMMISNTRLNFTTIYYELNKSDLTASTIDLLRPVIDVMKSSPNNVVYISGYADEQGGDTYNFGLSLRRVKEVMDYMTSQGVDMLRIRSSFYGAVKLSTRCHMDPKCVADTDRENRRVEIYVTNQK